MLTFKMKLKLVNIIMPNRYKVYKKGHKYTFFINIKNNIKQRVGFLEYRYYEKLDMTDLKIKLLRHFIK